MRELFEPKSIVLVGVSRQTGVGAYNGLEMLLRYGYQGRIYVVHPKAEVILGQKVYPRVQDLPEVPELAVIAVGRDLVPEVAEECFAKGIRWLVIITQGFADADTQGKKLQAKLVAAARQHQAHIVGPNTMGVLNAFTCFSTAFVEILSVPLTRPRFLWWLKAALPRWEPNHSPVHWARRWIWATPPMWDLWKSWNISSRIRKLK